ncbi:MAG: hypothetical protein ACE5EE_04365 [Fidelibacterota bacterium]
MSSKKLVEIVVALSLLSQLGCLTPSEPNGVRTENQVVLETVGYCRDLDLNDSILVAAADQNGYVVYSIEFGSDGSFSYKEIFGTKSVDHDGEIFQGGGVLIASRYNYFLLMDQADALYYINFTDVDSAGRIPYPGSENRDYVRGFAIDESDSTNLVLFSLNRSEDGNSTFISSRSLLYVYDVETSKVDFYFGEFEEISGLNKNAEDIYLGDRFMVIANSQLGVKVFQQDSDGSLNSNMVVSYNINGGYEVQTVMNQGSVIFAGLSNDGGCHIAQVSDEGEVMAEVQIAKGYTVQGLHLKSGVLALACGSDGVILYEWEGFDSDPSLQELGRLNTGYAYNVKVYDTRNIFVATRSGVQLFQIEN